MDTLDPIIVDANGETVDLAIMERDYGTVATANRTTVYLTQQPYLDIDTSRGTNDTVYAAHGVDAQGNIYSVTWDLIEDNTSDDESDACDWDHPRSTRIIARA